MGSYQSNFYSKPSLYRKDNQKKYSSKRYFRARHSNQVSPEASLIGGVILLLVLVWVFVLDPAINYIKQHILFFSILGFFVFAGLVSLLLLYIKLKIKKKNEKEAFERVQIENGLIKFVDRFGNDRWGKPEEVQLWSKEDELAKEKERLINQVVEEISNFRPARVYRNEFPYQIELVGYLKSKFPHADIEQQRGSSRPDIIIGDVAIEVKGPTRTEDLQTIADKCIRYYQHFGELIIVLFEVQVYEPRYEEWKKGIENSFPRVKILRK